MRAAGESGSVVTLLCDAGERYARTYYADGRMAAHVLDATPYDGTLATFAETGQCTEPGPNG